MSILMVGPEIERIVEIVCRAKVFGRAVDVMAAQKEARRRYMDLGEKQSDQDAVIRELETAIENNMIAAGSGPSGALRWPLSDIVVCKRNDERDDKNRHDDPGGDLKNENHGSPPHFG